MPEPSDVIDFTNFKNIMRIAKTNSKNVSNLIISFDVYSIYEPNFSNMTFNFICYDNLYDSKTLTINYHNDANITVNIISGENTYQYICQNTNINREFVESTIKLHIARRNNAMDDSQLIDESVSDILNTITQNISEFYLQKFNTLEVKNNFLKSLTNKFFSIAYIYTSNPNEEEKTQTSSLSF